MTATFSAENRLRQWLNSRRMTADSFSTLAQLDKISGASQSRLNQALNKGRSFDNSTAEQLLALRTEIEALVQAVAPIPLDLSNAQTVHDLLKARRAGELQISVTWNQA
jgi:hypothetical protein